jgi:hypothetical protein
MDITWLLLTNKHSILIVNIYLQIFRSFHPTFWFHMPFILFSEQMISAKQFDNFDN